MQTIQNKKGLKFFIAAVTLWAGAALAQSGNYPNKPIKFIVPYPPGRHRCDCAYCARTSKSKFGSTSDH